MHLQRVKKLHLWTDGDASTGIAGEIAEVFAPGWLVSTEHYEPDEFRAILEEFRVKVRDAFTVIWPNERVYARYDFELREENAGADVAAS